MKVLKIIIIFAIFFTFIDCGHLKNNLDSKNDSIIQIIFGHNGGLFGRKEKEYEITEHDIFTLLDNDIYSEHSLIDCGNYCILIPHLEYLNHLKDIDTINILKDITVDSVNIFIEIFENGKKIKNFTFNNDIQIRTYIKKFKKLFPEYKNSPEKEYFWKYID